MTPDPHAIAMLVLTLVAFALFASERVSIETTGLLVLVAITLTFQAFPYRRGGLILDSTTFFFGFSHEALIAICSLMVLGRGLVATGAFERFSRLLARMLEKHPNGALLVILVLCSVASGVLNDTPIVVLMMPVLVGAALRAKRSPARTLLPMNYAVLIGGMGTTIGTSTNLIVVSIAADLGVRRFGMFDFVHVTAIAGTVGILYLWLVLPRLIPERHAPLEDATQQVFSAVLRIPDSSFAEGKHFSEVRAKLGPDVLVRRLVRGQGGLELARLPDLTLRAGDRLHVSAAAKALHEAAALLGTTLHKPDASEHQVDAEHPLAAGGERLAEVVVTETSMLNGRTLRETRFGDVYDVMVVGIHRPGSQPLRTFDEIALVEMRAGDILLVQGAHAAIRKLKSSARLLVLDQSHALPRTARAPVALGIFVAVVSATALSIAPIAVAGLAGVAAMILTSCISWKDAAESLSMKVVLLIASSLALGTALEKTGATTWLASCFVAATSGLSGQFTIALLMLLTAAFTNLVSNSSAAAVATPIAVSTARELGAAPEAFVLAIMFAANFSYVTPMAYQTNLLVMSAGGYRFSDFVRGGLPLLVIMLVAYTFLLPIFFPL